MLSIQSLKIKFSELAMVAVLHWLSEFHINNQSFVWSETLWTKEYCSARRQEKFICMIFLKPKNLRYWLLYKIIIKGQLDVSILTQTEIIFSLLVTMMVSSMCSISISQAEKNMPKWLLLWKARKKWEPLLGPLKEAKLLQELKMVASHFGMPLKENQFVTYYFILDVLQSFDTDITGLHYIESKETLIASSKGKALKVFVLPKEWRDAKRVAE